MKGLRVCGLSGQRTPAIWRVELAETPVGGAVEQVHATLQPRLLIFLSIIHFES